MEQNHMRDHIGKVIMERLDSGEQGRERRSEALSDFLLLNMTDLTEAQARDMAEMIPELSAALYAKWIGLFTERLFETIPADQLAELCSGSRDNNAALCLTYLMFMESARMEKQVDEDLAVLEQTPDRDNRAGALALWLRSRLKAGSQ